MIGSSALYICLAAAFLSFIFSLVYQKRSKKSLISGIYCLYWIRWKLCTLKIRILQHFQRKRIDNYDAKGNSYDYCGIVPTPSEVEFESPKLLLTDRHEDGIFFWGGDEDGRSVAAKVVRLSRRRASVSLLVRDTDGRIYTLPNQPDSNLVNIANEHSWRGNGLFLECVEPMRTWRVKFNGLLRCSPRESFSTNSTKEDDDKGIIYAKMDFLFKALKAPVDIWRKHSPSLLADALARECTCRLSLMRSLERDGYDQMGVMHGTVDIGGTNIQTWYLRGVRQHRWGMSDSATNLRRSLNLYSYFSNGDFVWVEGFSYKDVVTHCVIGYVLTASGSYHAISWTDLEMTTLQQNEDSKNIFIQISAGGKIYNIWHRLQPGMTIHTGNPWTLNHRVMPSYTAFKNADGWGLVTFTQRYKGICPVPKGRIFPVYLCPEDGSCHSDVLDFSDPKALSPSISGGKGASLSYLTHLCSKELINEFIVPRGIIVTSLAWKKQQEANPELKAALVKLEKAITSAISDKIKKESEKTVLVIEAMKPNEEIVAGLQDSLAKTFEGSSHKRLAVRSSGVGEDSDVSSSAGQNATFLGVLWKSEQPHGHKEVSKALLSCWASQFSYMSVEYRRQHGQALNEGMAVVIQEMVDAESAGVIFTRDPLTGSPETITITCNYGLGESVVSASAEPDTYVIKRSWQNAVSIQSKIIGEKNTKTIMEDIGRTKEISVSEKEKSSFCIGDHMALRLSRLAVLIEQAFGSPRDIEFAVKKGEIYLLQSRPITSTNEWTDYEIIHELDSPVLSAKEIYTIHNAGEVYPGYTTPLTLSTVLRLTNLGAQKDFSKRLWPSYKYDPSNEHLLSSFESTVHLNLGEIYYRALGEEKINTIINVVDLSIGGDTFTTKEIHKWALDRFGAFSLFRKIYRIGYTIYELFINPRGLKKFAAPFLSFQVAKERSNSANAFYKEICRRTPEWLKISEKHILTTSASSMSQVTACIILTENKEINNEIIQDIASLLSCFGETESGDVPTALKGLAKTLSTSEELQEFLTMTPEEGKVWMESHPGVVGKSFAAFIKKHGHRGYKEFDLHKASWSLKPEGLVEVLQKMAIIASSFQPKKEVSLENALETLKTPIKDSTKRALRFFLKTCGGAIQNRELTKSLIIRTIDAFRKAYRQLGHLMVSECRLPETELIFFLTHREIGTLLETRDAGLISKAIKRRRLSKKFEEEPKKFPEITIGKPKPLDASDFASIAQAKKGLKQIKGTPVCLGVARGPARVIQTLNQASAIEKGDILVTHSTDVGWTPYFPLLSGIITEIGGLVSHGAVVAREYGLPCVVGAKGATQLLTSGEEIILDGREGSITILQKNSNP